MMGARAGADTGAPRIKAGIGPSGLLLAWLITALFLCLVDPLGDPSALKVTLLAAMLFLLGVIVAALLAHPAPLRKSLIRLQLGPWTAIGFSIVFGLATLVWRTPAVDGLDLVVDRTFLIPAGMVASVGILSFAAGHRLLPAVLRDGFDRFDRILRGPAPVEPSAGAVLILWIAAMLVVVLQIRIGRFGYFVDPQVALSETSSVNAALAIFAQLGTFATFLAGWRFGRRNTAATFAVLLVVAGSQIGLGLVSAFKEDFVIQLLAALVGWGIWRPVRLVPVLLSVAFVVAFVFPFVTQYRDAGLRSAGRTTAVRALESTDFSVTFRSALGSSVGDSAGAASNRLTRIGDLTVIVQKTPSQIPYLSAAELAAGPLLGVVPRSVWHEKPVLDAGNEMSSLYYGLPTSVFTSSAVTPYGDLWRHGGLPVVVIGMAALGGLARMVDGRSGDPQIDPRVLFLPLVLFAPLVKQELDYLAFCAGLASLMLVTAVGARLVTATSPRHDR